MPSLLAVGLSTLLVGQEPSCPNRPLPPPQAVVAVDLGVWDAPAMSPVWQTSTALVRLWRAQALSEAGCLSEALALLEPLESELPALAELIAVRRARAVEQSSDASAALQSWQAVLKHHPKGLNVGEAHLGCARALTNLGHVRGARRELLQGERLAPQEPHLPATRLAVAALEGALGHPREAAERLKLLLVAGDPNQAHKPATLLSTWLKLGKLPRAAMGEQLSLIEQLIDEHRLDTAEEMLDAAASAALGTPPPSQPVPPTAALPSFNDAELQRGTASRRARLLVARHATRLGQRGDWAQAADGWRRLAQLGPRRERAAYLRELARALGRAGDNVGSAAAYQSLGRTLPRGAARIEAQFRAAFAAYEGRDFALAQKLFVQLAQAAPRERRADEAQWFAAWMAFHRGRLRESVALLERLGKRWPQSALRSRASFWRGRMLAELGQDKAAAEAFAATLRYGSDYYAGEARRHLGNQTGAGPQMQISVPLEPQAPGDLVQQGAETLRWEAPAGQRALALLAAGDTESVAAALAAVPACPGKGRAAPLGRAELLMAMGLYDKAVRLLDDEGLPTAPSLAPAERRMLAAAFPLPYASEVLAAAREFQLSPLLLWAVMRQESSFDPSAESYVHAQGLMQLMARTAGRISQALAMPPLSREHLSDPHHNIRLGAWYLRALLDTFGGNVAVATAGYNAGPTAVRRWVEAHLHAPTDVFIEDIPFKETRGYVKKVLHNLDTYSRLYAGTTLAEDETIGALGEPAVDF